MPRSSGLGKGLSSIIPTADLTRESTAAGDIASPFLAEVEVASIRPNPNQPRVHFDEQSLLELSSSIAEMGVLQPVLVRRLDSGAYELIAGERRWRAAQRAGLARSRRSFGPPTISTRSSRRSSRTCIVRISRPSRRRLPTSS